MRRYLASFAYSAVSVACLLASVNWLVDPYRVFGAPEFVGLNAPKSRLHVNERIFKTVDLARQPAAVVIIGSSRADHAMDPRHAAFVDRKALNLAMEQQPYAESRAILEHLDPQQTTQVLFGIDFFLANDLLEWPASFVLENFAPYRRAQLLFSLTTVQDSLRTLQHARDLEADDNNIFSNEGKWGHQFDVPAKGNHGAFLASERSYLLGLYTPEPHCAFAFDAHRARRAPMDDFRAMLAVARSSGIDLRIFISPSHARQWETLAAAGLWERWEDWKRQLVSTIEEEAARSGYAPFPLWDFSGYDSISSESVPPLTDTVNRMRNYLDSSHYSGRVGDLVLDRILDFHSPGRGVPPDFGVPINRGNIEEHLLRIRSDRAAYRSSHGADVAEIEALALRILPAKQCGKRDARPFSSRP